jgi:hypothetical protein
MGACILHHSRDSSVEVEGVAHDSKSAHKNKVLHKESSRLAVVPGGDGRGGKGGGTDDAGHVGDHRACETRAADAMQGLRNEHGGTKGRREREGGTTTRGVRSKRNWGTGMVW